MYLFIYFFPVVLLMRIQESEDKGVCTRALWCLAKQNLDSVIINTKVWSNIKHVYRSVNVFKCHFFLMFCFFLLSKLLLLFPFL